jgi:putative transcriptional regulator
MILFRLPELLLEKERQVGRRIPWREVSEATGISRQVLANLASRERQSVTNTAYLEAICRYFECRIEDVIQFCPPIGDTDSCHIDGLYPNRRDTRGG